MAVGKFPKGTPFHDRYIRCDSGCWEWQAARTSAGYGHFTPTKGVRSYAHRFAWQEVNGPIPEGMHICHKCDNPRCCNPDHLFLGTHLDNIRDRQSKGRTRTGTLRGEDHPSAKFTAEEIRSIRARAAAGETRTALARELNVTIACISLITLRRHYKEV